MAQFLTLEQKRALEKAHMKERNRRYADRIKTILLLDLGLSYDKIAQYLLLDDQTIRNYETRYKSNGIDDLLSNNYIGCASKLTPEQEEQLKIHL